MPGTQETLGARQTLLPKELVTDAARSGAQIFQTPREVRGTGRDGSMPRDVNTAVATASLNLQSPNFMGTSDSPTLTENQDIVSPRRSIIMQKGMNAEPLDAPINQFWPYMGTLRQFSSRQLVPKQSPEKAATSTRAIGWNLRVIPSSQNVQNSWIWGCGPPTQRINSSLSLDPQPKFKG